MLGVLFLVLISALVYANTLGNPFIWSEESVILGNPDITELSNIPSFFTFDYWINKHPFRQTNIYRPLRIVSFALDYSLWGFNPIGWHLTNILFHAGTVVLLYLLIKKLFKGKFLAFLASSFFATHPVHVESITWIMSRGDVMTTFFFLLALLLFVQSKVQGIGYYIAALVSFVLALLSREMGVTLPLILVLYVFYFLPKKEWKRGLLRILPFWLILLGYGGALFALRYQAITCRAFTGAPLLSNAILVVKTLIFYLKLLLVPINLCADYFFPMPAPQITGDVVLSSLLLLAFVVSGFWLYKYSKLVSFSLLWLFLTFPPIANIVPIAGRPVAEQRLYLPSIGFCLLLAWALEKVYQRWRRLAVLGAVLILGLYSYGTIQRNAEWQSPVALWSGNVRRSPLVIRARRNLAGAFLHVGDEDAAIAEFEKIVELEIGPVGRAQRWWVASTSKISGPIGFGGVTIIGKSQEKICEMGKALAQEAAVRMEDPDAAVHNFLGRAYRRRGDLKRAAYEFNMAIFYDPQNTDYYNQLGIVYGSSDFTQAAILVFEKALEIKSNFYPSHHNLGITYEHAGKYKDAIKSYEKVIELAPEYDQPHLRLSIIYAKCEIDKEKAKSHWDKYLALTHHPEQKYVEEMKTLLD